MGKTERQRQGTALFKFPCLIFRSIQSLFVMSISQHLLRKDKEFCPLLVMRKLTLAGSQELPFLQKEAALVY